jgi:hypothetical protein
MKTFLPCGANRGQFSGLLEIVSLVGRRSAVRFRGTPQLKLGSESRGGHRDRRGAKPRGHDRFPDGLTSFRTGTGGGTSSVRRAPTRLRQCCCSVPASSGSRSGTWTVVSPDPANSRASGRYWSGCPFTWLSRLPLLLAVRPRRPLSRRPPDSFTGGVILRPFNTPAGAARMSRPGAARLNPPAGCLFVTRSIRSGTTDRALIARHWPAGVSIHGPTDMTDSREYQAPVASELRQ